MKKADELKDLTLRKKVEGRLKSTKGLLARSLSEREVLEAELLAVKTLKSAKDSHVIAPRQSDGKSEATAFAIATDWHVGSTVSKREVNGLNEYSVDIAKARVDKFFERTASLARKERQDCRVDELVLFLGGDLIDGSLHLDTVMAGEVATPIRQAVIVQGMVESGLNYLKKHGGFKRITVVCADGN